jgi:hypothetical protein
MRYDRPALMFAFVHDTGGNAVISPSVFNNVEALHPPAA